MYNKHVIKFFFADMKYFWMRLSHKILACHFYENSWTYQLPTSRQEDLLNIVKYHTLTRRGDVDPKLIVKKCVTWLWSTCYKAIFFTPKVQKIIRFQLGCFSLFMPLEVVLELSASASFWKLSFKSASITLTYLWFSRKLYSTLGNTFCQICKVWRPVGDTQNDGCWRG